MNRAILASSILLAAMPIAIACQKTGADAQAEANEAQQRANREIGRANAQAVESQRTANEKIAAAEADFIKLREDYRAQTLSDLSALDTRIAKLDAKVTGEGRNDPALQAALPVIHQQRAAVANDVRALDAASAATFDATKARLDKELADLKAAVARTS
jgi:hypothetical protein